MNKLAEETSPYLLQHKDNPVDWYPWGSEAFEIAEREDKPVLVSIGYSTCHWCHVMERESFEDPEVAGIMNEHFVNIKVDREEYPDVDQFYMEAVQILTRSGGWPLNCFLTPEGKPFYGGTYFPPESKYGRPSWKQLLQDLSRAFEQRRKEIEEQAEKITRIIEQGGRPEQMDDRVKGTDPMNWVERAVDDLVSQWDREFGGFGGAPKFPSFPVLIFLFEYGCRKDQDEARELVLQTLEHICLGGIYDQVGGGLCRYSVDEEWNVPHFEKMMYDNAMLLRLLNRVYRDTGDELWKRYMEKTVDFVLREWWDEEQGGFYSAFDADSEGEEGKYYVWTLNEWKEVLPERDRGLLTEYYRIEEEGNWEEGKNIPNPIMRPDAFAEERDLDPQSFYAKLSEVEAALYGHRQDRIAPGLDFKKLLSWNAWMASALVEALELLEREEQRGKMLEEIDRLTELFSGDGGGPYVHHITSGQKGQTAYLDDYMALVELMTERYTADWDTDYLDKARDIMEEALELFEGEDQVLLTYSSKPVFTSGPKLPDFYDQTTPSGNAQAAMNLWNLGVLFDLEEWRDRAWEMIRSVRERMGKFPRAFSTWLQVAGRIRGDQYEIAVIGPDSTEKVKHLRRKYIPSALIMASNTPNKAFPLLDRTRKDDETVLYLCSGYSCERPVTSLESFMKMLKER